MRVSVGGVSWAIKQRRHKYFFNNEMKWKKWNATPAHQIIKCISSDRSRTRFISLSHLLIRFHSSLQIAEIIMYLCNCMTIPLFFPMNSNSEMLPIYNGHRAYFII